MSERNAAAGYAAMKVEANKGVAVTPDLYAPYYNQSLVTDPHLISDEPVYGAKFKRLQSLPGTRSHGGSLSVMAEPNTCAHWLNMLATKTGTIGSNPYTHAFGSSNATDPKSYTVDISFVSQVVRFTGVEASKITFGWQDQKMVLNLDVSGLKSFYGREISSIATTTVNLTTDYDTNATAGLVVGDLVYVVAADGQTKLSTTITSITDADTVVLGASAAAFAAGDMLVLRPATPSLALLTPFLWPKTEFRFGATAAAALSATHTPMDSGTEISVMHEFEEAEGSKRSGSFDPASLLRTVYDVEFKAKKYFDLPNDIRVWNAKAKQACVMRAFSGANNEYELRVTMNHMKTKALPIPSESASIIYEEPEFVPQYDTTDAQGFDVKVINALSTV
jgi:hypothetical protein